jgi:TIR domain
MPKITISYRRTDSDATGRIFDRLVQRYGRDSVFRDIDDIPFGIDFRKVVNDTLRGTDVLIAVVGPNWRGGRRGGRARINEDNDLVRIELETALQTNIPVIPVLVGGAVMPKAAELPETLRDFSFRNAANIDSGRNFDTDVERLMRSMDRLFETRMAKIEAASSTIMAQPNVDNFPRDMWKLEQELRRYVSTLGTWKVPVISVLFIISLGISGAIYYYIWRSPLTSAQAYSKVGNLACFGGAEYPNSWREEAPLCAPYGCNFGKMSQDACLTLGARKQSNTVIHGNPGATRANECWLQDSCGDLRPHNEFTLFRM